MIYEVIFDVTKDGLRNWWVLLVPTVLLVVVIYTYYRNRKLPTQEKYTIIAAIALFCVLLLVGGYFIIWQYYEYSSILNNGECLIIEGKVKDITIKKNSYDNNDMEVIVVNREQFSINDNPFNVQFDYLHTLQKGAQVRLHYYEHLILKVEVVRNIQSAP